MHALGLLVGGLAERAGDPATLETVRRIAASSQALEEMFTGLLDLSRLDTTQGNAEIGPVALAPLLERLEAELAPVAEEKGLSLVVHPRAWFVRSEPVMLRGILSNLLHNAIRYTQTGRVVVDVRTEGAEARIDVRDTGPGIPKEEHERVFEAFHRAPGTRGQAEGLGLGLGLAVAKGLAYQLHHQILLHSEPGNGSVFSVIAERAQPADVPTPSVAPLVDLRFSLLDFPADEASELEDRLESWGCVSAEMTDADVCLIACESVAEGLERLGGPGGRAVILLTAGPPEPRPCSPDAPVFGLARNASPARIRALLMHVGMNCGGSGDEAENRRVPGTRRQHASEQDPQ